MRVRVENLNQRFGPEIVGISNWAPRAAWVKLIGTSQTRSSPWRAKMGCSCTLMTTYRSPGGPPRTPASPSPVSLSRVPVSTPAGIFTSQFTLYGDCRKGRRPSYSDAAPPDEAQARYDTFVQMLRNWVPEVQSGQFQAIMEVELLNSGPVTLIIDSP